MKKFDFTSYKNVFTIGDIHGNFRELFNNLKFTNNSKFMCDKLIEEYEAKRNETPYPFTMRIRPILSKRKHRYLLDNSLIFILGDCGFGFNKIKYYDETLTKFNKVLADNNSYLFFIRGNHDDPSYFTNNEKLNFSNIILLEDYSIIKTMTMNILIVGGGLSIDKSWRIKHEMFINRYRSIESENYKKLYWENENISNIPSELMDEINENDVNVVFSHMSPSIIAKHLLNIKTISWFKNNKELEDEYNYNMGILDNIYDNYLKNKVKLWLFGHYHREYNEIINDTLFKCCDDKFHVSEAHSLFTSITSQNDKNSKKTILHDPFFFMPDITIRYDERANEVVRENNELQEEENEENEMQEGDGLREEDINELIFNNRHEDGDVVQGRPIADDIEYVDERANDMLDAMRRMYVDNNLYGNVLHN